MTTSKSEFLTFYERYSKMVFGAAMEITANQKLAEEILLETFKKAHHQNLDGQTKDSSCLSLIKLLIKTAHEILPDGGKPNIRLKMFESSPTLHQLLCEQVSLENHCEEKNISRVEARKNIRAEVNMLRKL